MKKIAVLLFCLSLILILSACSANTPTPAASSPAAVSPSATSSASPTVPVYTYKIIKVFPHDKTAFTEGLDFDNGILYESTGIYGSSTLRRVDLTTGKVLQSYSLPSQYFAEGITVYKNTIDQLTWQSNTGFVYDRNSFSLLNQFSYPTEGWGLTFDGQRLIMSDGTSTLHFLNPDTFESTGDIEVRNNGNPVDNINELEYIKGQVYANIWKTDRIALINPQNGQVTGWIDLTGLLQTQVYSGTVDVLNGIAYDSQQDRIFVTGKLWPFLFQIEVAPKG